MKVARFYILALFLCLNVVVSESKTFRCDFTNSSCLTIAVGKIYNEFVNGYIEGFPSSDPLFLDVIESNNPYLKHTKYNVTLSGLRNCDIELLKLNTIEKIGYYNLLCHHLVLEGQYEVNGELMPSKFLEVKGDFKEDFYDYAVLLKFHYKLLFDGKKTLIDVSEITRQFEPRDEVVYSIINFYTDDSKLESVDAVHEITNDDWKLLEDEAQSTAMNKFIDLFVRNIKIYLSLVSLERIFTIEL